MSEQATQVTITLKADTARSDMVRGYVWFVNYAALDPEGVTASQLDSHGTGMLPEDVEKLAHRWLVHSRSIDIQHDGKGRPVTVLESFYNSDDVQAAAWPKNAHCVRLDVSQCPEALNGLRNGTLNSLSLDAYTFMRTVSLPAFGAAGKPPAQVSRSAGLTVDEATALIGAAGYSGLTTLRRIDTDHYIVERGALPAIALVVADDGHDVEVLGTASTELVKRMASMTVFDGAAFMKTLESLGMNPTSFNPDSFTMSMAGSVVSG